MTILSIKLYLFLGVMFVVSMCRTNNKVEKVFSSETCEAKNNKSSLLINLHDQVVAINGDVKIECYSKQKMMKKVSYFYC